MKCKHYNQDINHIVTSVFNHLGNDVNYKFELKETSSGCVYFETDKNWTGYELTESEQKENVLCPNCHHYPFGEIQVYDVVQVIMFEGEE